MTAFDKKLELFFGNRKNPNQDIGVKFTFIVFTEYFKILVCKKLQSTKQIKYLI